ncbi:hypothetical protein IWW36_004000 [Coemansia brasiliensis]|uniref:PhoD-like phosphatase domain-containing protein n=1 Tax=Coemansia brasiliensis TaxID=2650707 RepID=A0A9W8I6R4_9FUNG|nr:hypothetical protein IWW36_004000 [Coemansia brasiliensis]
MAQQQQITSSAPIAAPGPGYSSQPGTTFAPGYGPPNPNMQAPLPGRASMDSNVRPPPMQQQQQQPPMQPPSLSLPPLVGPLLQFVNVELERALWHGSVLVLTNESLLPHGARPLPAQNMAHSNGPGSTHSGYSAGPSGSGIHGGPTPVAGGVQTTNLHVPIVEVWDDGIHGPGTGKPKTFAAKALYTEPTYKYTFWRIDLTLALPQESEVDVVYQIFWGADETAVQSHSARPTYSFRLPAQASQWRMCVTSNNQFSRTVPEAARVSLNGSGPVFRDLLTKHKTNPFHVWIGTGGQFNGEGVWDDCEHVLRPFLLPGLDNLRRSRVVWTTDMVAAVERWYLLEYLRQWFGVGGNSPHEMEGQSCFRQAAETIPYSFTPDSEIFPGFGSYIPVLQSSPVFMGLRSIGVKYFALFQAHTMPTLAHSEHDFVGEGYHSIKRLGPYTALLTLDTRTERHLAGIIDRHSYDVLFAELEARVPMTATNLIVVASNPIIFPRTKNFEMLLRSANNAGLTTLFSYAVNGRQARNHWMDKDRFGESVAVTRLNDFWTSAAHKSERSFVVHALQEFSRRRSCRVTFASGHVNCLSSAHFRTYTDSKFDPRRHPEQRGFVSDFRSMIQLTVSGLVQEPADGLTLRAYHFAGKSAPFDMYTEEKLYHTFNVDVNHLPPPNNNQKLLGRRSYGIIIEHDFDNDRQRPGLLSFFYVENETCTGTAMPYIIRIPSLRFPHLPIANEGRPQMKHSVSYRNYTGAGALPSNDDNGGYELGGDPYSYNVPGVENSNAAHDGVQGQQAPPPPYSPVHQQQHQEQQQQAVDSKGGALPPRTDGTYSSSYEHTAAWVQGGSQTTGSDAGGPSYNHTQQAPLSAHQQPTYVPVTTMQPQNVAYSGAVSQPPQFAQAPVQQASQAGSATMYSQPPYSQPVEQARQQMPPPQSSSSHPSAQAPPQTQAQQHLQQPQQQVQPQPQQVQPHQQQPQQG